MSEEKTTLSVIEALLDKISSLGGGGLTADQLETIITKTAGNTANAMRTALIPENKVHPGISAFSYPEGDVEHEKPTLKRTTLFCGARQTEETLTPEEIDAFNAIDGPYEAHGGSWRAYLKQDGTKSYLIVHCDEAADRDRARDLPSLLHILYELKRGPQAVDLVALTRQLETMRLQLAAAGVA